MFVLCYDLDRQENKRKAGAWLSVALAILLILQLMITFEFKQHVLVVHYITYFFLAFLAAQLAAKCNLNEQQIKLAYSRVLYFDIFSLLLVNLLKFAFMYFSFYRSEARYFSAIDLIWLVLIYHHYRKHRDKLLMDSYKVES